jgi:hypothetical protein
MPNRFGSGESKNGLPNSDGGCAFAPYLSSHACLNTMYSSAASFSAPLAFGL